MSDSASWQRYLQLIQARPDEFQDNGSIHIITDWNTVQQYQEETGQTIGVCYESSYHILVVDLVCDEDNHPFAYERILSAHPQTAIVCVPRCNDRYILLYQYRHALRDYQYAFPRGFSEIGLTTDENAKKELSEELNATVVSIETLGTIVANSGLSGTEVEIKICQIENWKTPVNHEGIISALAVTFEELTAMIAKNEITDGFTLAAYSKIVARRLH